MSGWWTAWVGCALFAAGDGERAGLRAATLTETAADTGDDTGDAPTAPTGCPFAGSWTIAEARCGGVTLEDPGVATITGTAELCEVQLVMLNGDCEVHEELQLRPLPLELWEAYSDGAASSACWAGEPHEVFDFQVEPLSAGALELSASSNGPQDDAGFQVWQTCEVRQYLRLEPLP